MQLGESFLILGALVIFSLTTLMLNDFKLENNTRMMEIEFETTAIGIAQQYIEEAQALEFDEALVGGGFSGSVPADFTAPASLGAESGESYPGFDDVDDFHGYTDNISTTRADFTVSISIVYLDTATIASDLINRTTLKNLIVTIKSSYFSDSLMLDYVYAYR